MVVSRAGAVLLVETARKTGLGQAISAALASVRHTHMAQATAAPS